MNDDDFLNVLFCDFLGWNILRILCWTVFVRNSCCRIFITSTTLSRNPADLHRGSATSYVRAGIHTKTWRCGLGLSLSHGRTIGPVFDVVKLSSQPWTVPTLPCVLLSSVVFGNVFDCLECTVILHSLRNRCPIAGCRASHQEVRVVTNMMPQIQSSLT